MNWIGAQSHAAPAFTPREDLVGLRFFLPRLNFPSSRHMNWIGAQSHAAPAFNPREDLVGLRFFLQRFHAFPLHLLPFMENGVFVFGGRGGGLARA